MHAKAIAIRGGIKEGRVSFIPKGKEELAKNLCNPQTENLDELKRAKTHDDIHLKTFEI